MRIFVQTFGAFIESILYFFFLSHQSFLNNHGRKQTHEEQDHHEGLIYDRPKTAPDCGAIAAVRHCGRGQGFIFQQHCGFYHCSSCFQNLSYIPRDQDHYSRPSHRRIASWAKAKSTLHGPAVGTAMQPHEFAANTTTYITSHAAVALLPHHLAPGSSNPPHGLMARFEARHHA